MSNPPYIRRDELPSLQAEVQFEPAMALDGGADGYRFYRAIMQNWSRKLKAAAVRWSLSWEKDRRRRWVRS